MFLGKLIAISKTMKCDSETQNQGEIIVIVSFFFLFMKIRDGVISLLLSSISALNVAKLSD